MSDSNNTVWDYFVKCDIENKQAKCTFCENIYDYSTTHNLKKHLETKHINQITSPISRTRTDNNEDNSRLIWEYFTKLEDEERLASCNICKGNFSYKSTIANLKKHLKTTHGEFYASFIENKLLEDAYLSLASTSKEQGGESPIYAEIELSTTKNTRKNHSFLWNFFGRVKGSDKMACCKACNTLLSYRSTLTNLKKHLMKKHSETFSRAVENLPQKNNTTDEVVYVRDEILDAFHKNNRSVWEFFTKKDEVNKLANCDTCNKDLSYKTTTANLKQHLKVKHKDVYNNLTENQLSDLEQSNEEAYLTFDFRQLTVKLKGSG